VVHTCNPSTWEAGKEDCEFKANLGYLVSSETLSQEIRDREKEKEKERERERPTLPHCLHRWLLKERRI
jgi:hypothetical protein